MPPRTHLLRVIALCWGFFPCIQWPLLSLGSVPTGLTVSFIIPNTPEKRSTSSNLRPMSYNPPRRPTFSTKETKIPQRVAFHFMLHQGGILKQDPFYLLTSTLPFKPAKVGLTDILLCKVRFLTEFFPSLLIRLKSPSAPSTIRPYEDHVALPFSQSIRGSLDIRRIACNTSSQVESLTPQVE